MFNSAIYVPECHVASLGTNRVFLFCILMP